MPKIDFGLRRLSWILKVCGLFLFGFCFSYHGNAQAHCTLACNNLLQISVDGNCEVDFTADLMLEGNVNPLGGPYFLTIADLNIIKAPLPLNDVSVPIGTYQFKITNGCNNSCWGSFFAEHNINPIVSGDISCPEDDPCEFPCVALDLIYNDTSATTSLNPGFDDLCTGAVDVKWGDRLITDNDSCTPDTLIRTWTTNVVKHGVSMHVVLAEQYFVFEPIPLDYVICPKTPFEVPCEVGSDPDSIMVYFNDTTTVQNEGVKYAYPYVALTGSGTGVIDPNSAAGMAMLDPETGSGSSIIFAPIKSKLGKCNLVSTYVDNLIPICQSGSTLTSYKVIRTWSIFDWCTTESINCVQVFKVVDEKAPTFYVADTLRLSTSPWVCSVDFKVPPPDSLSDNCSNSEFSYKVYIAGQPNIQIVGSESSGYTINNLGKGDNRLVYEVNDNCGNMSKDTTVLWINDNVPPVAIAKEHIVVSLTSTGNSVGYAKLFAPSVDNGSYDICTPVKLEIRRDSDYCDIVGNDTYTSGRNPGDINYETHLDSTQKVDPDDGAFVKFCCADLTEGTYGVHKVWMRVWDDANMDGVPGTYGDNYNEVWAFVRVEDKLNVYIDCPDDITVRCDDDITNLDLTGRATAEGTCSIVLDYEDTLPGGPCPTGTVIRRWFIDGNQNDTFDIGERYCSQRIKINDLDPMTCNDIIYPRDTVLTCALALIEQEPIMPEDHCGLIGYSVDVDIFEIDEEYCYKIIKTFTVIDWCQYDPNSGSTLGICRGTQKIAVYDETAPTFVECKDKVILEGNADCEATNVELKMTALDDDNCPKKTLRWNICLDINNDDDCDFIYYKSTDSGEELSLTLIDTSGAPLTISAGPHKITWVVTDDCDNSSSCESLLIIADMKNPTPICIESISTAVMGTSGTIDIWAIDFDPTRKSFDNCDNDLTYSFSGTEIQNSITIGCSDGADLMISNGQFEVFELQMWVWDDGYDVDCDGEISLDERNKDFCTVQLRVDDNVDVCQDTVLVTGSAMIAGRLQTEYGDMVSDAQVMLDASHPEYPSMMVTQSDGQYAFGDNPMEFDYEVTALKTDAYINGVSTLDLVLMQKHILGLELFDSPYKVIASDINNDQKVSGVDLIVLRKLILGIYDELPDTESWRFVEKAQEFQSHLIPFPFAEYIEINGLDNDEQDEDFIGVKIGDVNGNAKANNLMKTEVRSSGILTMSTTDRVIAPTEVFDISLSSSELVGLYGLQFTLAHADLELVSVTSAELDVTEDNIARIKEDNLTSLSWSSAQSVQTDEALFTIRFRSKTEGKLSTLLDINSSVTKAEAYLTDAYKTMDVAIEFEDALEGKSFALFQNEPNPFSEQTSIGFYLPKGANSTLTLFDVTGKVLLKRKGYYAKGMNSINVESSSIGTSGILYYQLEAGEYTATKKMVLLH